MDELRFTPGAAVGDYRLERRLAMGGMAEVWGAYTHDRQRVALKMMRAEPDADGSAEAIFLDELRLSRRLNHENVVRVWDGFQQGPWLIQVMEWVDGLDFRRLFQQAERQRLVLDVPVVLAVGRAMARGLAYVHSRTDDRGHHLHVIHRDVSPANVMLTREGRVKILDFGIAKARRRKVQTAAGVVKGKAAYMSPEQALGRALDQRSDIFSMGVVLWELLRTRRLFSEASPYDVVEARVPSLPVPGLPAEVDELVQSMLSASVEARPATMTDVERALSRSLLRHFEPDVYSPGALAAWLLRLKAKPAARTAVLGIPAFKTEPD